MMNDLPDFTPYGYRFLEVLSNNIQGGRITYKAVNLSTDDDVIIKQFQFASSKNWAVYRQVEREINVLENLEHIGIPKYVKTINHPDGFCFVQNYINAPNLSISRTFDASQIKSIISQLLEILVYLQLRIPPIIHRDVKPENVLYDAKNDRVYLVDFGMAKIGTNESALSSIFGGTPGFMPPEQLLCKPCSNASDLYGLGATIICLVTGIKSTELNTIIDESFTINFKSKVSQYNPQFISWLERMVEPKMDRRFSNAKTALKVFNDIDDLVRSPEVNIDQSQLVFKAQECGEILTQTLTINNPIPDTLLRGVWSVYPHHNDPPHTPDNHAFISFSSKEFEGNNIRCKVIVDTSKLQSQKVGERTIILTSNAGLKEHPIKLKIETASCPKVQRQIPIWYSFFFTFCFVSGNVFGVLLLFMNADFCVLLSNITWLFLGYLIGIYLSNNDGLGFYFLLLFAFISIYFVGWTALLLLPIFGIIKAMEKQKINSMKSMIDILLTFISGSSIGWLSLVGIHIYAIFGLIVSIFYLLSILIYSKIKQRKLSTRDCQREQSLIEL
ncbi:serine/threonine protein kinase [Crocosphaera sp.]|uniref:serine/threonine protein kinase n=1 Tax=Crocosphaera sp. TaxID=2729996 RepID=UPI003F2654AE